MHGLDYLCVLVSVWISNSDAVKNPVDSSGLL